MDRCCKYLYRVELVTNKDVVEFNKIATQFPGRIYIVSGNSRLNAKSFLGVHLAKVAWSDMYIESDENCYFAFRKFIKD